MRYDGEMENSIADRLQKWFLGYQEAFAAAHFGHNVRRVQPVVEGWSGPTFDGLNYLECLDCDKRSNGKKLYYEKTETGHRISVNPLKNVANELAL